jgi:hypothetical protein
LEHRIQCWFAGGGATVGGSAMCAGVDSAVVAGVDTEGCGGGAGGWENTGGKGSQGLMTVRHLLVTIMA